MTKNHLIMFFHLMVSIQVHTFCYWYFFLSSIFKTLYFENDGSMFFWQNTRIYFQKVDFWSKVILYLSLGKSTTQIAIMAMSEASRHLHLSLILWCRHSRFLARLCDKVSEWVRVRTNLKLGIIHKEVDSENGAN